VHQGCQIYLGTTYQNEEKFTKIAQNIPNYNKIPKMATKYTKKVFQGLPKYIKVEIFGMKI
jgi:hypothetical protein